MKKQKTQVQVFEGNGTKPKLTLALTAEHHTYDKTPVNTMSRLDVASLCDMDSREKLQRLRDHPDHRGIYDRITVNGYVIAENIQISNVESTSHEWRQGFKIFFTEPVLECKDCKGTGLLRINYGSSMGKANIECPLCSGTGRSVLRGKRGKMSL